MMKRAITINNIPAIIWGDDSDRVIIAIHGNQSNKAIRTSANRIDTHRARSILGLLLFRKGTSNHQMECANLYLKGDNDDLCESNVVFQFAERFSYKLNITKEAGHYFHTPTELASLNNWLEKII